ncbi:MAG: hypothetical protein FGM40_07825 [Rhodocyclaceae bacterium]|nr:hypothetical protein [Rhodocyclaceae bacterium]
MKNLVVVGNAPLTIDYSDLIDSSDVVVRMNECKNYSSFAGGKTTIICVNNMGPPAWRYAHDKSFQNSPLCRKADEYWFVRSMAVHEAFRAKYCPRYPREKIYDMTDIIIESNGLQSKICRRFSPYFNKIVFSVLIKAYLNNRSKGQWFVIPSTGFFAIQFILSEPSFQDFQKHLVGFGFEGWPGHPWRSEKKIVSDYTRDGLLRYYPI